MELKHIKMLSDNVAELRLDGEIGFFPLIGADIAGEIKFIDRTGVDQLNVIINSPGGTVLDGFSIFSALIRMKATVVVEIDFMAASMAGIIAMAGDVIKIVDFGIFMIHDPSIGDGSHLSEKEKSILDKIRTSLMKVLVQRSALDEDGEEELDALMARETFLEADEAKDQNLVDEIIPTVARASRASNVKELLKSHSLMEVYNMAKEETKENTETKNINNLKPLEMKTVIAHLKLQEAANEDQVLTVVKDLETARDEAITAKDTADEKIKTLEADLVTAKEAGKEHVASIAEAAVDTYIEKGIFDKDDREDLITDFKEDPESFKKMADRVKAPVSKVADLSGKSGAGKTAEGKDKPAADKTEDERTIKDWQKEDPKGLGEMMKNDQERYIDLYKATYKVEPNLN